MKLNHSKISYSIKRNLQEFPDNTDLTSSISLKAGDIIQMKKRVDFLQKDVTCTDHFDLYIPVPKNDILIVLKPFVWCGDWRFSYNDLMNKIDHNQLKNKSIYDIVIPLTACAEFLYGQNILYLETMVISECIEKNWISIYWTPEEIE